MKEVYRLKKGNLSIQNLKLPFDFGLVFEHDGIFYFEFYISEQIELHSFKKDNEVELLAYNFSMHAKTDKNNELEATELVLRNIIPRQSMMKMQSSGFIKHTEIKNSRDQVQTIKQDKKQTLVYLEIEGLKLVYTDFTKTLKTRDGIQINKFNDWKKDYTTAVLKFDGTSNFGDKSFKFTFFPCESSNNVQVTLLNFGENGHDILYYDMYKDFKRDLTFFLSFLNGAEIAIRKEFIGGYYNKEKVSSQTIITHSFKTVKNESHNKYIPLNSPSRGGNILDFAFVNCFNKYVAENKKLDLNSIVFYLNGADRAVGIEEKFFIQIIAFERLAQKYKESIENSDILLLQDESYKPIKDELLLTLNKFRKGELKSAIDTIKGRIGDLHKIKKTSTEYKFKKLLEYAKISITPEIKLIIEEVRHKSVHHGYIGKGRDGVKNYLVLDELLRDIILNIIGYNEVRKSRYRNVLKK